MWRTVWAARVAMRPWSGIRVGPGTIVRAVLRLTVVSLLQGLPPTTVQAQSGTLLVDETRA